MVSSNGCSGTRHGRLIVLGMILGAVCVSATWAYLAARRPMGQQLSLEILKKLIPVEVVREIRIEGPERVVERIVWKTEEISVEVPVREEVIRVVEKAAELGSLYADVEVRADKYEGTDADGRFVVGWLGSAVCRARADQQDAWTVLVDEPFERSASMAQTTIDPRKGYGLLARRIDLAVGLTTAPGVRGRMDWYGRDNRWGLWGAVDWNPNPETIFTFNQYQESYSIFEEDTWVFAAGIGVRLGR